MSGQTDDGQGYGEPVTGTGPAAADGAGHAGSEAGREHGLASGPVPVPMPRGARGRHDTDGPKADRLDGDDLSADRPDVDGATDADATRGHSGEPDGTAEAGGMTDLDRTAEIGELIGRLSAGEDMDRETRGRLLARLAKLLGFAARRAGASGFARGRWLADIFADVAPRIPIRDLQTLSAHHGGLRGERLAAELIRNATLGTTAVGAAGGALAAVEFAAPPLLLTAPAQLVAETLVVAAIEVKLIAELHEVYGVQVPGSAAVRATVFLTSWAKQRGINPADTGSLTNALGVAAKQALRRRLLRTLGRSLTTMGPFLTGAVAGGALNRSATRRLAEAVGNDLRRQVGRAPDPMRFTTHPGELAGPERRD